MDFKEFILSTKNKEPPQNISKLLLAAWYAKNNLWDDSHNITQLENGHMASRLHAYLHRIEGDVSNANYWYKRANIQHSIVSLDKELDHIIKSLLLNKLT